MAHYKINENGVYRDFWSGRLVDPFSGFLPRQHPRHRDRPQGVSEDERCRFRERILRDRMGL